MKKNFKNLIVAVHQHTWNHLSYEINGFFIYFSKPDRYAEIHDFHAISEDAVVFQEFCYWEWAPTARRCAYNLLEEYKKCGLKIPKVEIHHIRKHEEVISIVHREKLGYENM